MANTKQKLAAPEAHYEAVLDAGKEAVAALNKGVKDYEGLVAEGKENLEALVQANTAAVAGAERLNKELVAYLREGLAANLAVAKALAGVKTVQDVVELQKGYVEVTLEKAVTTGTKLSQSTIAVANDVAEPLKARAKVALDKILTPLAA